MFTTGSKLLIGSSVAAGLFAAVYGIAIGGSLGTIGLVSAALALSLLAAINVMVRDSNVSALDHESFESAAAAQATARPSVWPLLMGIGVTTVALGLVTYRAIFMLGIIAMLAAWLEWLIQDWSERASADPSYNKAARDRLIHPLELPVVAAIGGAVVVYSFSRVMLGLPSKTATVVAFSIAATVALVAGTLLGQRRSLSKGVMTGAFSVIAIALVAGGAVAGLNGERDIEPHETTAELAEHDACGPEETHADTNASQTVATKSNLAAEITFSDGTLTADVVGHGTAVSRVQLPRSNPNNVMFRNESDAAARFVIELHPDEEALVPGPERLCTTLVEPGGLALLTIEFNQPSFAVDGGFEFVVAGTDAALEVIVP